MDPLTVLITTITAGAVAATKDITTQVIKDSYAKLKALIIQKSENQKKTQKALAALESVPQAESSQKALLDELQFIEAAPDHELIGLAKELLDVLKRHGIVVKTEENGVVCVAGDIKKMKHITGDIVFQRYGLATSFSEFIRIREFKALVDERTRNFIGREYLLKAVNDTLTDPEFKSGYILITGEPGIGKTALLTKLIKENGYIHHFNIAAQNIRSVHDFLGSVCAQLIVRYQLCHACLPSKATVDGGFLSQLMTEASVNRDNRPVIIVIDALDEVEQDGLPADANCLFLPQTLPEGVYVITTSRPQYDMRLHVDNRKDIFITDTDPENLRDVRRYIWEYVSKFPEPMTSSMTSWGVTEDQFIKILTEKSEGNFMYLVHVLPDIKDGRLTISNCEDIHNLPKGLRAYYQRHWRTLHNKHTDHRFMQYEKPVICTLTAVSEPVTINLIGEWTRLDLAEIKRVLDRWYMFLNIERGTDNMEYYRIYHQSFKEFVKKETDLKYYHNMIVNSAFNKIKW